MATSRRRSHRSASPAARSVAPGVAADGQRGDVWRAVALQAHWMGRGDKPPGKSVSHRSRSSGPPSLGEYGEMDFDEKQRRHQASLTLAQRMGLVVEPGAPLTAPQWEAVKLASDARQDSDAPCSICLEDFKMRPQVILSCSHVFHAECMRSFERFAGSRRCPICRQESYDLTPHVGGFQVWRKKCASRIQRAWRGYKSRKLMYDQLRDPSTRADAPALHRRMCGRALQAVNGRMTKACEEREDALDRFLESLDNSVASCSEKLREGLQGFEALHGETILGSARRSSSSRTDSQPPSGQPDNSASGNQGIASAAEMWAKARRAALERSQEEGGCIDCPICFQPCDLTSSSRSAGGSRIELLSCSHVFHRCCLLSFESFHVFEVHQCPVCRQQYERRPWHTPSQAASSALTHASGKPPQAPRNASGSTSLTSSAGGRMRSDTGAARGRVPRGRLLA
mmetsp:Transcript_51894/g.121407  ORF Transcript_51894/g.121407 Transcript_51894/m.121407 type:complete len:455 (-) Transcript_51894:4-1368(-)